MQLGESILLVYQALAESNKVQDVEADHIFRPVVPARLP